MAEGQIHVLLVEDNLIQRRLIERLLAGLADGRFALECSDRLATGLERLAIGDIDVVLLDLMLPDSEGLQTFLRVRRAAVGVPIVVLTGLDDQVLALTVLQEGAEDFLVKGRVDGENLGRSLRFAIERSCRRKAEDLLDAAHSEFRAARAIQQKLLPTVPQLSSFDIAGLSYCAIGTCGDYFDYIRMPNDNVGIMLADVSGHGLGPSLLMASMRAYVRALARTHDDVGEILTIANRVLIEDTQSESFITAIFGCLNPHTRSFVYANAGHPTGYVLDATGAVKSELESGGFPLGLMSDHAYQSSGEIILQPGEFVVLVSDGILDARSPQDTMFGKERTLDIVRVYCEESALQIVDNLYYAARGFSQHTPQLDDITAVVLKVGPPSSAE
ncbi:MAG TPA: fused response regulator/phosphatase [Planctomycetaceae bacterium]|nr:fused response regulator/phosphatase [Planctomycetaceae bacterium]